MRDDEDDPDEQLDPPPPRAATPLSSDPDEQLDPPPERPPSAPQPPPASSPAPAAAATGARKAPPCTGCGRYMRIMVVMRPGADGQWFTICSRCYRGEPSEGSEGLGPST